MSTHEWTEGYNAWKEGKTHNHNPYTDEKQANDWDAGFEFAAHTCS